MAVYVRKALELVESELELLKLKIQYPDQFLQNSPLLFQSNLHIAPESKNLGVTGVAEIVVSLFLLGAIVGRDGKPAPLIQIAKVFEQALNFSFGNIYDKQDALFKRKPYNLTKTLDVLKNAIMRKAKQLGNL